MTTQLQYILGVIVISFLISISLYLEMHVGFIPCPLCILQRFTFGLVAILFFIGAILPVRIYGHFVIPFFSSLACLLGIILAGRQVWLQYFPPANNECGVTIQYMLQVLPLSGVIQKIFSGSAECSQRGWEFLSLSIAEWSLIWFILLLCFSVYLFLKEFRRQRYT